MNIFLRLKNSKSPLVFIAVIALTVAALYYIDVLAVKILFSFLIFFGFFFWTILPVPIIFPGHWPIKCLDI
ncbi:MAG: hypothetical protein ACXVLQ_04720 [Bacteriovorax sp.]